MEVSMPTGSLCAERNVIGTALSDDITLRREDIKMVAVYAASMPLPAQINRTGSVGYGMGMMSKQNSVNFNVADVGLQFSEHSAFTGDACERAAAASTVAGLRRGGSDEMETPATPGGAHLRSPQRSGSVSFETVETSNTTPFRGGGLSPIQTDFACLPCSMGGSPAVTPGRAARSGSDPGPPSQANTPIVGTPSPQHGTYYASGGKSPQALGKRKIMDIGRQYSLNSVPGAAGTADASAPTPGARKAAKIKAEGEASTAKVLPSAAPATRSVTKDSPHNQNVASSRIGNGAGDAKSTASASSAGSAPAASNGATTAAANQHNSRRRTKTVAFTASSTSLVNPLPSPAPLTALANTVIDIDSALLLRRQDSVEGLVPTSPNGSQLDLSLLAGIDEMGSYQHLHLINNAIRITSHNHHHQIETETISVDRE
jgi:hypothetical protein